MTKASENTSKSTIDQILESYTTSNSELVAAAEIYKAQRIESRAKKLAEVFNVLDTIEESLVRDLKVIRKRERVALDHLKSFNAAKETFMKTGDIDAMEKETGFRIQ